MNGIPEIMPELIVDQNRNFKAQSVFSKRLSEHEWRSESAGGQEFHTVMFNPDTQSFICDCGDFIHRGKICKHIISVIRKDVKNINLKVI